MNVDLYVLRYECIQMYNVWCASDGSVIWFEESKKKKKKKKKYIYNIYIKKHKKKMYQMNEQMYLYLTK